MAILIDENTKILVQGITGHQGSFHAKAMKDYGAKVVAGVTPGKGGSEVHGIPVYDTVKEAMAEHEITASIIFVPARFVLGAAIEAIDNGIPLITIITEHVPVWDAGKIVKKAEKQGIVIVGPNTPGILSPNKSKLGIIPGHIVKEGDVGIVSRSGTLTYEIIQQLTTNGFGQSTCVGIGGDPLHGIGFIDALKMFEEDPQTKRIILIGEIGGNEEELAAEYIKNNITKEVYAFIAGVTAPPGKKMGHAGAIITGSKGTAKAKIEALEKVGVKVARLTTDIPKLIKENES